MRYMNISAFVIPKVIVTTYISLFLHHYSTSRIKVTLWLVTLSDKIIITQRHIRVPENTYAMLLHHFRQLIPVFLTWVGIQSWRSGWHLKIWNWGKKKKLNARGWRNLTFKFLLFPLKTKLHFQQQSINL